MTGPDGGRRTYSGLCAAGQAIENPVLVAYWFCVQRNATIPDPHGLSTDFKVCSATHEAPSAIKAKKIMAAITTKRESRKSLQQPGWITFEGGFAARQCLVQDMSSTGAKITIDDPNALPAKLRLALTRDARTGRNCEVVWRRGMSVGIKFVR